MTKQDFELIADVILTQINARRRAYTGAPNQDGYEQGEAVLKDLAGAMATRLQRENPRFQRSKFLKACGVQD